MRHRKAGRKLGRNPAQRRALLRQLTVSMILHERLTTTEAKAKSLRPVVEKLAAEFSLCLRYHNVTFRGQALKRLVLGGGEASPALLEVFSSRLDLKCELGDPWRTFDPVAIPGRRCQWDVAVGLALRTHCHGPGVRSDSVRTGRPGDASREC